MAQQISGEINHLTIKDKTDFLPLLKARYAALLPRIRSAKAREEVQRSLEKKIKKQKDLESQWFAYKEEYSRITQIIEREKAEKKLQDKKAVKGSAL